MKTLTEPTGIFTEQFISGQRLYYSLTGRLASGISSGKLVTDDALAWFQTTYGDDIAARHQKLFWSQKRASLATEEVFFLLKGDVLINFDHLWGATIYFTDAEETLAQQLLDGLLPFLRRKPLRRRPEYNVIAKSAKGLDLVSMALPKASIKVASHYNDDLLAIQPQILKQLRAKTGKGLHLFYGPPGTGKSTYLRHLISRVRNKDFIFLSPHLAAHLDSPDLISLLLHNPNSILIIEDAEELLVSRDAGRNSAISFLLNLTDGLLGESLNIQVVCTFNTSIAALDKALLRKGRLQTLYEFKALAPEKTLALLQQKGHYDAAMTARTLAEIYNINSPDFAPATSRVKIGFGANLAA